MDTEDFIHISPTPKPWRRVLITHSRLLELLSYDPLTGDFKWRKLGREHWFKRPTPGHISSRGYRLIKLDGRVYYCHRLAWFYVHGVWPNVVDHINSDGLDNRLLNLRNGSSRINTENQRRAHRDSKTKLQGVIFRDGKFRADIQATGKRHFLGRFDTPEEAYQAYLSAKRRLHEGCTI
jgi:hypothetical protein